jgi:hypothetical protein
VTRITGISSLAAITLALGCQQSTTPPPLRSLAQSGSLSMVCRDMVTGQGQDIKGCPDPRAANTTNNSTTGRHTLLLVTQTGRGEVAVIDMTNQRIVDEDSSIPGTEFLPIGWMPVSIASTPGGAATFVATAEQNREAIFVLPTSCIMPPSANEPPRDLTQWSACKLPAAPGEMVIVPDATITSSGGYRQACPADSVAEVNDVNRSDCPADWDADERIDPPGRRKLLITLPTLGGVVLLDARSLYNLQPGSFERCPIERWLPLSTQVPTDISQEIPKDLKSTCSIPTRYSFGPTQTGYVSQPAGIAFKDNQLYVADLRVPLVHNLDLGDPCNLRELPPLVPSSIDEPTRSVFTSDVAVSDLTHSDPTREAKRFVYAVDDYQGSLMAFDVSPGSQQRSPLVLPGSPYLPFDPPDRIRTNISNARVRDLMFVTHDVPIVDPASTSTSTEVFCDPDPNSDAPGSKYRTSSDYTLGAAPPKLRGTFAVVALTDGLVGVVDVEDFDAPCRRPVAVNQPWRGCVESISKPYITSSGSRSVSDEVSCKVVEPHRARSGRFVATNATVGTGAPSLPTFPALTSPSGELAAGYSSRGSDAPKLLAVPYPVAQPDAGALPGVAGHSVVYVGSTLYSVPQKKSDQSAELGATFLDVAPSSATNNSVLLPFVEPRAYLPSENFSLTYEGKLFDDRQSGYLDSNSLTMIDPDARFCDQGVQDIDLTTRMADDFVSTNDAQLAASQRAAFAPSHSDFVQITSTFSDNDPYWTTSVGSACAKASATGISGINGCRSYFGTAENNNLKSTRELTILEAYQDKLVLEPRDGSAATIANLHCCFPGTVMYTVRGAHQWVMRGQQPMINVTVDVGANNRCVRDCNPRKTHLRNRAIEIASSPEACLPLPDTTPCTCASPDPDTGKCSISTEPAAVGPSTDLDAVCVVGDDVQIDPNSTSLPAGCVFDSLKARFAVYAGALPSVRDMTFTWQVSGGFVPYELNLANNLTGASIMPQSMTPAPNLNALFVVDSVSGGVFELVLDPFGINGNPYL